MNKSILIYIVLTLLVITCCKRQTFYNGGCYDNHGIVPQAYGNDRIESVAPHPLDENKLIFIQTHIDEFVAVGFSISSIDMLTGEVEGISSIEPEGLSMSQNGVLSAEVDYNRGQGLNIFTLDYSIDKYIFADYWVSQFIISDDGKTIFAEIMDPDNRVLKFATYDLVNDTLMDVHDQERKIRIKDYSPSDSSLYGWETGRGTAYVVKNDLKKRTIDTVLDASTIEKKIDLIGGLVQLDQQPEKLLICTNRGIYLYNMITGGYRKVHKNCNTNERIITYCKGNKLYGFGSRLVRKGFDHTREYYPFIAQLNEAEDELRIIEFEFNE